MDIGPHITATHIALGDQQLLPPASGVLRSNLLLQPRRVRHPI